MQKEGFLYHNRPHITFIYIFSENNLTAQAPHCSVGPFFQPHGLSLFFTSPPVFVRFHSISHVCFEPEVRALWRGSLSTSAKGYVFACCQFLSLSLSLCTSPPFPRFPTSPSNLCDFLVYMPLVQEPVIADIPYQSSGEKKQ